MKNITRVLLGLMCLVLGMGNVVALSMIPKPFSDVDYSNFAFDEISWLKQNGVVKGYEDGAFRPDQKINRAEFLKMVYEADPLFVSLYSGKINDCIDIGYDGPGGNPNPDACDYRPFPDVKKADWFEIYVSRAKLEGVINGYPDGTFKPENNINYAEALKIVISQYLPDEEPSDELCEGGDYNEVREDDEDHLDEDAWYYDYVKIGDKTCINDFGSSAIGMWGYFNVGVDITRADMAVMLYRAIARSQARYDVDEPNKFEAPRTLSYCRSEGEDLDNGRTVFPIAGEYENLPFLGQLFTAMDYCGYQSAARLFGVNEGDAPYSLEYVLGSTLNFPSKGASADLRAVLAEIGFVCTEDTDPCEKYRLEDDAVEISKLFKLAEFVEEMEDDDCVHCG